MVLLGMRLVQCIILCYCSNNLMPRGRAPLRRITQSWQCYQIGASSSVFVVA
jgi:hypothetical protein